MKLLYIASVRIPNEKASALAIMRQCEAFAEQGVEVTLLIPNRSNHIKVDPFEFYGVRRNFSIRIMKSVDFYIRLGVFGFYIARFSQMIYSLFFSLNNIGKYDLIYTRDPWMVFFLTFFRKRYVLEVHKTYSQAIELRAIRRASLLICISSGLKRFYVDLLKLDSIIVEPSGVNVSQFLETTPEISTRLSLGIPNDAKVIGYIGKYKTMGEDKGVEQLVSAFAEVYTTNSRAFLLIVGLEEAEIGLVENICSKENLPAGSYKLLPLVQKDFPIYVMATDVLVMNYPDTEHYRNYMSPTKLFAYMASARLIISSDLPTIREIVDDSMVVFFPPESKSALVSAIRKSISDEFPRASMVQLAKNKVSHFSWSARSQRILKALEDI